MRASQRLTMDAHMLLLVGCAARESLSSRSTRPRRLSQRLTMETRMLCIVGCTALAHSVSLGNDLQWRPLRFGAKRLTVARTAFRGFSQCVRPLRFAGKRLNVALHRVLKVVIGIIDALSMLEPKRCRHKHYLCIIIIVIVISIIDASS